MPQNERRIAVSETSRRVAAAPRLREARLSDYPRIVELQSRNGFEPKSYHQWAHVWLHNPVYNKTPDWPIGWVLERENHEIVGYIGNIPLSYEFRGRQLVVATSQAWVVDTSFRSYSFSLLRQFFTQKKVDLFLNTTVNAQAEAGQKAFGASRVPAGSWDRSFFWITRYRGFMAGLLANKGIPAAGVLSVPLSVGFLFVDTIAKRNWGLWHQESAGRFCTIFDARFDRFWEELRRSNSCTLLATRSQQMLAWRFQSAIDENRAWVLALEEGPRLAAYAIFLRQDNRRLGLNRLRLVDFQSLDGQNERILPMLLKALNRCRREGIHMLEAIGFSSEKQHILNLIPPHRRVLPSWLYFYKVNDQPLAKALADPRSWDPSSFDGDASL